MRIVAVEAMRATVELSIDEPVLLLDALWRELDARAKSHGRRDEVLRARHDALQEDLAAVVSEMDTADDEPPGLS